MMPKGRRQPVTLTALGKAICRTITRTVERSTVAILFR